MPTLEWIGKGKVVNHHQDVPFRVVDHRYTYMGAGATGVEVPEGNMVIKGDNLEALKALLPQYEGRIKCIYIDPPYNTGNEGWVYNDNVNDPKIMKWLGAVVGKEGEDLSRHDKWLCMMYPRLKLLRKLLHPQTGVIFISIDENEYASLKMICDEIFGANKHVATTVWQKRYSRENREAIGDAHEYIVVYASDVKVFKETRHLVEMDAEQAKVYKNPNNDPRGRWRPIPMTAQGYRPNQMYPITTPAGKVYFPPAGRCWSTLEHEFLELKRQGRIYFGKNNSSQPNIIRYLSEVEGVVPWTWWTHEEVGHTDAAKKEIYTILGTDNSFDTPKPVNLLERIIRMATDKDSVILDSFAGSGTTAHAVLNLNKADGGTRKFILVEMMDYAENITAERVRRVIDGYANVNGTGGSFGFYELGEPLMFADGNLNEAVPAKKIRNYVWYMETRQPAQAVPADVPVSFLGEAAGTAYYFHYEKESITTLDLGFLKQINIRADRYIIYADQCSLSEDDLKRYNITFKKIPRDIAKL